MKMVLKARALALLGEKMDKLKILIVEDESLIALDLAHTITSFGYNVVEYATTPDMARKYLQEKEINLILMDINLNAELTGIELYASLKINIPIIYLTAYKDEETISKAVETNPLGYLVKPLNEDELNALLKLSSYKIETPILPKPLNSSHIKLGEEYYFDQEEEKLFYKKIFINLGKKELELLKLLIAAKGNIISFETIENQIWQGDFVSDSSLRTLIYRLRGKLEYKLIETVFNHGIKLL